MLLSEGQLLTCLPHRPAFLSALQTAPSCMKPCRLCQISPPRAWALSSFRSRKEIEMVEHFGWLCSPWSPIHLWGKPANLLVSAVKLEKGKEGWQLWLQCECVCVCACVCTCINVCIPSHSLFGIILHKPQGRVNSRLGEEIESEHQLSVAYTGNILHANWKVRFLF